jgi:hypothetical protein
MQIQQLTKEAEKVYVVVQNVTAATVNAGIPLVLSTAYDGFKVIQATAGSTDSLFVGINDVALAQNAVGLAQVYGIRTDVPVTTTTAGGAIGGFLGVSNGVMIPTSAAGSTLVTLLSTITSAAAASASTVFIRAL